MAHPEEHYVQDPYSDPLDGSPLVTASDVLEWRRRMGAGPDFAVPGLTILGFDGSLLEHARRRYRARPRRGLGGDFLVLRPGRAGAEVGLLGCRGVGAPVAAVALEELAALGVRRIVGIGLAGSLVPDLVAGDVVVAGSALRGDGVSSHYLPPGPSARADPSLTEAVAGVLRDRGVPHVLGTAWTTDALYRETRAAVARARRDGAIVVDLEAAAIFAVGAALGVATAAVLVVADSLAGDTWKGPDGLQVCRGALTRALDAVVGLG